MRRSSQPVQTARGESLVLRLYVASGAPHSTRALENLRLICRQQTGHQFALEVIDVLREPLRALKEGILVTPTLVKVAPEPVRMLVGDLSEMELVLSTLGLARAQQAP